MKIMETIKQWFQGAAAAKEDQLHQAEKGDKPPADKGGIGATPSKIEDAEQDWKGDT